MTITHIYWDLRFTLTLWCILNGVLCQCVNDAERPLILKASSQLQYFSSLNYPDAYITRLNCEWIIEAPSPSEKIIINVEDLSLDYAVECIYDKLRIYDGRNMFGNLSMEYCRPGQIDLDVYVSSGSSLFVKFITHGNSVVEKGFNILYFTANADKQPPCGSTITLDKCENTLMSPNLPNTYSSGFNCHWLLYAPHTDHISLQYQFSDIEGGPGCVYASVTIYDGNSALSPLLDTMCSTAEVFRFGHVITSSNQAAIYFNTSNNATTNNLGFVIKIWNTENECSQLCSNTNNGNSCYCYDGFTLDADNVTCNGKDINECILNIDKCEQLCINTVGSYVCRCIDGYKLKTDGRSCDVVSSCGDNCVAGGMVSFAASDNGLQIIMHGDHLYETNVNHNCTADNIDQRMKSNDVSWYASFRRRGYGTDITCKDFNIEDRWSLGYSEMTLSSLSTTDTIQYGYGKVRYLGVNWKNLTNGDGRFQVFFTVNTSIRTDTGSVNNSPTSVLVPVVKFRYGCLNTHRVIATDIDGDFVKCRLAVSRNAIYGYNECQGICGSLAGIEINMESCVLSYNGAETGTFAVAVQVEDFIDNTSITPLSSVPVQFIVTVTDDGQPCDASSTTTTITTTPTSQLTTNMQTTTTPTTSPTTSMQTTITVTTTSPITTITTNPTTTITTKTTKPTFTQTTEISTQKDDSQLYIILLTSLSVTCFVFCVMTLTICMCVMRQRRHSKRTAQRANYSGENMADIGHQNQQHLAESTLTNISDLARGSDECN